MGKIYTSSRPDIISDYGYEPLPTIYKDSEGQTIYVTDQPITGVGTLENIPLVQGMNSLGALIFKTELQPSDLI